MNKKFLLFILMSISLAASAAPNKQDSFSCEKIKETSVRAACIKWRNAQQKQVGENESAPEKKVETSQKEKQQDDSKQKELDEFVRKAKSILVQNYKDPESVQFKDLIVAKTVISRALCGSVNAKNSYGGYVGFKKFYVSFDTAAGTRPTIWYEGESTKANDWNSKEQYETGMQLRKIEAKMEKMNCGPDEGIEVTQVQ